MRLLILMSFFGLIFATAILGQAHADGCSTEVDCQDVFTALFLAKNGNYDPAAARLALERACDLSATGQSCYVLGVLAAEGVLETAQDADHYFESGCRHSNPEACAEFARRNVLLSSHEVTDPQILDLLYQSCLRGDPLVCAYPSLSLLDRFSQSGTLCEEGDMRHCTPAGWFAFDAQADKAAASVFFTRACDAGRADACYIMADQFVTQSSDLDAIEAMKRSCSLGHVTACEAVINVVPSNEMLPVLTLACERTDHPMVCARSAFWGDASVEMVVELFEQACLLGYGEACLLAANDGLFYLSDFKETLDDLAQKDPPRTEVLVDLGRRF